MATTAVFIGVLGEGAVELFSVKSREIPVWRRIGRISLLILVIGLAGELLTQVEATSKNDKIIASLNLQTEHIKAENLRLASEIKPRRLNPEQVKELSTLWKAFSGHRIEVVSYALDLEGGVLATQILRIAGKVGMSVTNRVASVMPLGGFDFGIVVSGPASEQTMVMGIASTLATVGSLGVQKPGAPTPSESTVRVLVGVKPLEE